MDMPWGSLESNSLVTCVGLITSKGASGDNVMAAEGTHHVSYSPGIFTVSVGNGKVTAKNILETKTFGVSLASEDQNIIASIAGGNHGQDVDKIAVLHDLGFRFVRGKETGVYLVEGAVLQVECKLINHFVTGDHTQFVGNIVSIKRVDGKRPLIYHEGKFWKFGEQIHKPGQIQLDKIKSVIDKHRK